MVLQSSTCEHSIDPTSVEVRLVLTWQRDEGLTLHPSCQQSVNNWRPVLLLKSGEQRHQLCDGCLRTQVLHTQNLQRDKTCRVTGADEHVIQDVSLNISYKTRVKVPWKVFPAGSFGSVPCAGSPPQIHGCSGFLRLEAS